MQSSEGGEENKVKRGARMIRKTRNGGEAHDENENEEDEEVRMR